MFHPTTRLQVIVALSPEFVPVFYSGIDVSGVDQIELTFLGEEPVGIGVINDKLAVRCGP